MKKNKFKSDLVLLFELASGWELEQYIRNRASRAWPWAVISEEMNDMIKAFLTRDSAKAIRAGLFKVMPSNLSRWYDRYGIKSKVKRGPKISRENKRAYNPPPKRSRRPKQPTPAPPPKIYNEGGDYVNKN